MTTAACYFRKFIQATPTTNYVIKICDKQAANHIESLIAEYSVIPLGHFLWGKGKGQNNIPYTEPHPHMIINQLPFSSKFHCTPKSHCHTFQQMHHNETPSSKSRHMVKGQYVYTHDYVHTHIIHAYTYMHIHVSLL